MIDKKENIKGHWKLF